MNSNNAVSLAEARAAKRAERDAARLRGLKLAASAKAAREAKALAKQQAE